MNTSAVAYRIRELRRWRRILKSCERACARPSPGGMRHPQRAGPATACADAHPSSATSTARTDQLAVRPDDRTVIRRFQTVPEAIPWVPVHAPSGMRLRGSRSPHFRRNPCNHLRHPLRRCRPADRGGGARRRLRGWRGNGQDLRATGPCRARRVVDLAQAPRLNVAYGETVALPRRCRTAVRMDLQRFWIAVRRTRKDCAGGLSREIRPSPRRARSVQPPLT